MNYTQAVNNTLHHAMKEDSKIIFYGLGATDPKRLFNTTTGLVETFGSERVFDMPTAENGMTGIGIGAALQGYRPIMAHQRLDFFLLAMDQLVNSAAKWHYMFGGQDSVPITIRLILGRGWGQGPTHSQNLQSWMAHIPGLRVVIPSTPADAQGLLLASIYDDNPVVFLEHRWLHNQVGEVPEVIEPIPLGKAKVLKEGPDLTIVSSSYMTVEALRAVNELESQGIHCDLIDLRCISPLDWDCIEKSVDKTGRLLALDTSAESFSVASEIVSHIAIKKFSALKQAPQKLASPDYPVPTSFGLTKAFYPESHEIAATVAEMLEKKCDFSKLINQDHPHDVPGEWFKGPF